MRTRTIFVALLLLAAACGGDDGDTATIASAPAPASESEGSRSFNDPDEGEQDVLQPLEDGDVGAPVDFGEDTNIALFDCVEGDDFACDLAYDFLGGDDGVRAVADACDQGDAFLCQAFDRIVEVRGEGGEEPAADEQPAEEVPVDSGELNGFVVVRSDGIFTTDGQFSFGDDPETVVEAVSAELGPATADTGLVASGDGSGCPGSQYRFVEWGDSLTLTILDDTVFAGGFLHVSGWQHDGGEGVFVELDLGEGTFDIAPGFTTVLELEQNVGGDAIEVFDEPPLGPTYVVNDAFGEVFGTVTDTSDEGIVQTAFSGVGCGE